MSSSVSSLIRWIRSTASVWRRRARLRSLATSSQVQYFTTGEPDEFDESEYEGECEQCENYVDHYFRYFFFTGCDHYIIDVGEICKVGAV